MMESKGEEGSFMLAMVIFCLTGQVAWVVENMNFNVFIFRMFHASAGAISAIAAAVTSLIPLPKKEKCYG